MLDTVFFYVFAALTLGGAVATITRRNAIHSALSLIVSLLGVAGLYLLQRAEFLFAVQIILYIGGIMVLFLFVIMLVNLDDAARRRQFHRQWPLGLAACALVAAQIAWMLGHSAALPAPGPPPATPSGGNVEQLAIVLFHDYLVPFEAASLLLLAAIVGSVLLARKNP